MGHGASFAVIRVLLRKGKDLRSVNQKDSQQRTPVQVAVLHKAPPGVLFEFSRIEPRSFEVRDPQGRSLLQLAVAADAPPWIIRECLEACPRQAESINLLSGQWPNTKAAVLAMQIICRPTRRTQRILAGEQTEENATSNNVAVSRTSSIYHQTSDAGGGGGEATSVSAEGDD